MRQQYGLDVTTEPVSSMKTNVVKPGISVHFEGSGAAPTVYPEDYLPQLKSGMDVSTIAAGLSKAIYQAHMEGPKMPDLSLEELQKHVRLALVNSERNAELLKTTPHFEIGDVSAIPRWYITEGIGEDAAASFVVSNKLASNLGLTPDEILQIARENTLSQEFSVMRMSEMMRDMMIKDGMDPSMVDAMVPADTLPMLVITTPNKLDGASCVLSESVMEEARETLEAEEIVILPSSRHEVIAIAKTEETDLRYLSNMVREINGSSVAAEDFLSDNPMRWDGHKLKMLFSEPKMDTPVLEAPKMTLKMGGF